MKLEGRVAIVTGASRGIGKVLALALAKEGCDVVAAAKSLEAHPKLPGTVADTAQEVEALGRRALAVRCDVRDPEAVTAMVEQSAKEFGRIDILINNAGALWWFPVLETPVKRFDLVHGVNVRGAFLCSQAVLPHMIEAGGGHIVNMSPPIDMGYLSGRVGYMISKFGMTMLSFGLADEVKQHGIAVNSLWPVTLIESQATINFGLGDRSQWRKADIMADATVALVSRDPAATTGQALLDEDVLRQDGVSDFADYACVPGSEPMRITWEGVSHVGAKASPLGDAGGPAKGGIQGA